MSSALRTMRPVRTVLICIPPPFGGTDENSALDLFLLSLSDLRAGQCLAGHQRGATRTRGLGSYRRRLLGTANSPSRGSSAIRCRIFIQFFLGSGNTPLAERPASSAEIHYYLWQQRLHNLVKELHQKIEFDLVHHVTYGRYWSPSGLRKLGLPFVWGPVGAAETPPHSFVRELPLRDRLFEAVRDGARHHFEHTSVLLDTARAATTAIGVTRETCEALRRLGARRVTQLPQFALTEQDLAQFAALPAPPSGPFRAICVGRHVHWKGFHLAIRAFGEFARKIGQPNYGSSTTARSAGA